MLRVFFIFFKFSFKFFFIKNFLDFNIKTWLDLLSIFNKHTHTRKSKHIQEINKSFSSFEVPARFSFSRLQNKKKNTKIFEKKMFFVRSRSHFQFISRRKFIRTKFDSLRVCDKPRLEISFRSLKKISRHARQIYFFYVKRFSLCWRRKLEGKLQGRRGKFIANFWFEFLWAWKFKNCSLKASKNNQIIKKKFIKNFPSVFSENSMKIALEIIFQSIFFTP